MKAELNENRESKNINLARKYAQSKGYSQEQSQKLIDTIRTDIPNSRLAQCKFLLGVTRMYLNGELKDYDSISGINTSLKYIASDAHVNEYNNNLADNNKEYSAQELIDRFKSVSVDDLESDKNTINQGSYEENSSYKIVRIPDFETASQYGKYTQWCITQDEQYYDSYTKGHMGIFYFCLRNGFENVPREQGENAPLDDYGLSMIAVSVNPDGSLNTCTSRWNHDMDGNDSIMDTQQISELVGRNFYQTFLPRPEEEIKQIKEQIYQNFESILPQLRELIDGDDYYSYGEEIEANFETYIRGLYEDLYNIEIGGNFALYFGINGDYYRTNDGKIFVFNGIIKISNKGRFILHSNNNAYFFNYFTEKLTTNYLSKYKILGWPIQYNAPFISIPLKVNGEEVYSIIDNQTLSPIFKEGEFFKNVMTLIHGGLGVSFHKENSFEFMVDSNRTLSALSIILNNRIEFPEIKEKFPKTRNLSYQEAKELSDYCFEHGFHYQNESKRTVIFPLEVLKEMEKEGLLINEAKASLQDIYEKYYSDIPLNDFNELISADPTAKPNQMGKFGKWILNLYRNQKLKVTDKPELNYALSNFVKYYNRIEKKDINQYQSVGELYNTIKPFTEDPNQATSKSDTIRKTKEEGAEKFYEDSTWEVIIPKTRNASCLYGKGTKWCTAADESNNMFDYYNSKGTLYININKQNGKKYQFHFESGQLMDERDNFISAPVAETIGLTDPLIQKYCQIYGLKAYYCLLGERPIENIEELNFKKVKGTEDLYIVSEFVGNDTQSKLIQFNPSSMEMDVLHEEYYNSMSEQLVNGDLIPIFNGSEILNLFSISQGITILPDDSFNVKVTLNYKANGYDYDYIAYSNDDGTYLYDLSNHDIVGQLSYDSDAECRALPSFTMDFYRNIELPKSYEDYVVIMTDKTVFDIQRGFIITQKPFTNFLIGKDNLPTFIFDDGSKLSITPEGRLLKDIVQSESRKVIFSVKSLMALNEALQEEEQLKKVELPKVIKNQLKKHKTSLGDNPAFPPEDESPFDYKLTVKHLQAITSHLQSFDDLPNIDDVNALKTHLSKLIERASKLEEPIKENLEKICFDFIVDKFAIPEDTVDFTCEISDNINVSDKRIEPEETDETVEFDGIEEIKGLSKEVYKRRFINALVQGAAIYYATQISEYVGEIFKLNPKLPELYDEILTLNTCLGFITTDKMDLDNPSVAGDVEVHLGNDVNKTNIVAKGLLFPVLLCESIKGFMELFASHGLPDSQEQASYILKKADFLLAEPWDIRLGVPLWEKLVSLIPTEDTKLIPLFFMEYVSLPVDKFNELTQEIYGNTRKGKEGINLLLSKIKYEIRKDDFDSYVTKQSSNDVVISDEEDEYFTIDELRGGI